MSCDGGSLLVFSVAQKSSYSITKKMYLPDIGSSVVFFLVQYFFNQCILSIYYYTVFQLIRGEQRWRVSGGGGLLKGFARI